MGLSILQQIKQKKKAGEKSLAMLIDPDKMDENQLLSALTPDALPDYFFVGGSHLSKGRVESCITRIKAHFNVPVLIFPGATTHIALNADAVLFLSLISGRNAEMLIGKHVEAAPLLKESGLEVIPTAYMMVESGKLTTAHYISQSIPIPADKNDLALSTAWAGEMLGLALNYLDAGSGALHPVSLSMIKTLSDHTENPLIVGGGIDDASKAYEMARAGADVIVVGNAFEEDPIRIKQFLHAVKSAEKTDRSTIKEKS